MNQVSSYCSVMDSWMRPPLTMSMITSIHPKLCRILCHPKPITEFRVRVFCTHLSTARLFVKIRATPKQIDECKLEQTNPQSCPLAKAQMNWIELTVGYHLASRSWDEAWVSAYGMDQIQGTHLSGSWYKDCMTREGREEETRQPTYTSPGRVREQVLNSLVTLTLSQVVWMCASDNWLDPVC